MVRALESKDERKDAKGTLQEKRKDECCSIGRSWKTGSSFNAAALKTQCRSIEDPMPQHWEKDEDPKIGRIANAAALRSDCRDIGP